MTEFLMTAAKRYYSPKERHLTREQSHTRNVAKALKSAEDWAVREAAIAIVGAHLIPERPHTVVLVPIPGSEGDLDANYELARAIAEITGASVRRLVKRKRFLPSQMMLRRMGLPGMPTEVQAASMVKAGRIPKGRMLVLIDNVIVTGATMIGAWIALGRPTNAVGIAYARGKEVIY